MEAMTAVFEQPIACPVLIGRAVHVRALARCLAEVRGGHGRVMVLAGEAGIGKSRLVAEARARAGDAGLLILQGNCFEPDRLLPCAPLIDLLRMAMSLRTPQAMLDLAGLAAPELAGLLPELGTLLPGGATAPGADRAQEKRRLFQALAHVCAGLAAQSPLLAVVEDLHWSDDISLEFLLHLARQVRGLPMLLVCTYRSDEVHPSLQHFLAGLDRERLATELALPRLEPAEADAMLRAIFDQPHPIRADFLHALYDLTDGNPFFIEEVIRSLVASGDIFQARGDGSARRWRTCRSRVAYMMR